MKKLALFLSSLTFVVTSCSVESADAPADNQNVEKTAFMSGDINNVSYSNLKPQAYLDASSSQTVVENYGDSSSIDYNYLLIQGSDVTLSENPSGNSVLINIRIPQSKWAVGTYDLTDDETTDNNGTDVVASFDEIGSGKKTKSISGTLTITEFDLSSKIIKGTFNFNYMSDNGVALEGPFQVSNGAFEYKLDAPFFNR